MIGGRLRDRLAWALLALAAAALLALAFRAYLDPSLVIDLSSLRMC